MTAVYLAVRGDQTPAEAWDDEECEGLYTCADHWHEARRWLSPEYRLVLCPADLVDAVLAEGQCGQCWDEWADGLRRSCEADATARLDDYLHRHR